MYNLVLSGGGIKGILHLGAIKTLEEKNLLKNIKNYGGTSAGSMIVLLLCIGYTYNDIMIIFLKINMDKFYDITDIFEFLNIYGLINFDPLEKLLRVLLENKFKKKYITFNELYNLTKKTLHINSINLNTSKETIFNYINTPNVDIIDACIASSSLPFIFPPKLIKNEYYIDAFAVNNCPCNIFENDSKNTICLTVENYSTDLEKVDNFQNYIMSIFTSFKNYNNNIKQYKPEIIINLYYDCSPIDFDLEKKILSDIFITGYNIANTYFKNNPVEKTTDENPTDENPTDENPTDENPTDENPTDENPTDEKINDEKINDETEK